MEGISPGEGELNEKGGSHYFIDSVKCNVSSHFILEEHSSVWA